MNPCSFIIRSLRLLHHNQLADMCLHEEENVEEDGGEEGSKHCPDGEGLRDTSWGDKPASSFILSYLKYLIKVKQIKYNKTWSSNGIFQALTVFVASWKMSKIKTVKEKNLILRYTVSKFHGNWRNWVFATDYLILCNRLSNPLQQII